MDGLPFGVMLTGPAFSDRALAVLAERFADPGLDLFVVGAHLTGQPLNAQLVQAGGTLVGPARTAGNYRLHALATEPPKPGLVRVAEAGPDAGPPHTMARGQKAGSGIEGEIWRLPAAGFGALTAAVPAPMAIGTVELADGRQVSGFLVEPYAVDDAPDITRFGGWRAYLASA